MTTVNETWFLACHAKLSLKLRSPHNPMLPLSTLHPSSCMVSNLLRRCRNGNSFFVVNFCLLDCPISWKCGAFVAGIIWVRLLSEIVQNVSKTTYWPWALKCQGAFFGVIETYWVLPPNQPFHQCMSMIAIRKEWENTHWLVHTHDSCWKAKWKPLGSTGLADYVSDPLKKSMVVNLT